ncbi:MAG: substrate-binding domain-containing protein [Clostridiales bacterium]|nr:substrate-binding domain-containing protein [Clostridiales bacterium]
MKRRIVSVMLVLGMLLSFSGCKDKDETTKQTKVKKTKTTSVSETEEPETEPSATETDDPKPDGFEFTESNFPYIFCSDEMKQLGIALSSSLLGMSEKDAGIYFLDTLLEKADAPYSVEAVKFGFCTPILKNRLEENDIQYEEKVIAQDAITMIVSKSNPVDSLTSEQVKKIYLGEITNWKEVGGNDEPIVPFANVNYSTATELFEDIVLGQNIPDKTNVPTIEAGGDDYSTLTLNRIYDNTSGAITFVQYFYAQECYFSDKVKILKIDDVEPSSDTIKSGSYPFIFDLYALVSDALRSDSPEKVLYDFLTTEDGKKVIEKAGYVPAGDTTASATDVTFDLDAYVPGEKPEEVYTRASDEPIMDFVPGDYGAIFPFMGAYQYGIGGCHQYLYGFVDAQGKIICDPIFSYIERMGDGMYKVWRNDKKPEGQVGIISQNGASFTDAIYDRFFIIDGVYTFANIEKNGMQIFIFDESNGKVIEGPFLKMNDTSALYCFSTIINDRYIICENEVDEEYFVFDGYTGEDIYKKLFGDQRPWKFGHMFEIYKDDMSTVDKVIDIEGNVLFSDPDCGLRYVSNEIFAYGSPESDEWKILNKDGKVLATIDNTAHDITGFSASDDYVLVIHTDIVYVYDANMELLALIDIPNNTYAYALERPWDYYAKPIGTGKTDPIIASSDGQNMKLINLTTTKSVVCPTSDYTNWYQMPGVVIKRDGDEWMILDSSDFHVIADGTGFTEFFVDNVTQKYYMTIRNSILNSSLQIIDVATGETVLEDLPNPLNERMEIRSINDGKIYYETQYPNDQLFGTPRGYTIVDMKGNVVFRYNGLAFMYD